MVNLGQVSSSVLGALAHGRCSNPGLNGENRAGNGSIRGDEVTPKELSGVLIGDVLQRDFQARFLATGMAVGKQDLRTVQGVEQHWQLCPFPAGIFLLRLLYYLAGCDAYVLSSQKQHLDMKHRGDAVWV